MPHFATIEWIRNIFSLTRKYELCHQLFITKSRRGLNIGIFKSHQWYPSNNRKLGVRGSENPSCGWRRRINIMMRHQRWLLCFIAPVTKHHKAGSSGIDKEKNEATRIKLFYVVFVLWQSWLELAWMHELGETFIPGQTRYNNLIALSLSLAFLLTKLHKSHHPDHHQSTRDFPFLPCAERIMGFLNARLKRARPPRT